MLAPPSTTLSGEDARDRQLAIARDGTSAWATFAVHVTVQYAPQLYIQLVRRVLDEGDRLQPAA
ncbi:MAG: hypothetical protein E6J91_42240 [Deltaproteobacteria bacterium]|nr:MAG: hypothetical protein E6J91_42240 [Deltaproteobacteria bacterium]